MENDNNSKQWSVPNDYFNQSKIRMLQKIELEEEKELFAHLYDLRTNVFDVPLTYFNPSELVSALKLEQLKAYPIFTVPDNYFSNNAVVLKQKLTFVKVDKQTNSAFSKLKKYRLHAAAAVIVMSLSFFVLNYFKNDTIPVTNEYSIDDNIDIDELEENDIVEQMNAPSNLDAETTIEQQLDEEDITNAI
jgi:hypothetical protein